MRDKLEFLFYRKASDEENFSEKHNEVLFHPIVGQTSKSMGMSHDVDIILSIVMVTDLITHKKFVLFGSGVSEWQHLGKCQFLHY